MALNATVSRVPSAGGYQRVPNPQSYRYLLYMFNYHFYFPAVLVRGFTVSDVLDQPWSQVSSLPPPVLAFIFIAHRLQSSHFSFVYARRFASNFANSRSRTFGLSVINTFNSKKELFAWFKPTTSTSIVTRLTVEPPETPVQHGR